MRTNIETVSTLKQTLLEILLNKTDKVSKVSNESVLNGILYGQAKLNQKVLKDIAVLESQIFVDSASGIDLDIIAARQGIASRFTSLGSSVYVKVYADYGTVYPSASTVFKSSTGVEFVLTEDFTMSNNAGYDYVKVRSNTTGLQTIVDANTITKVNPVPSGHKYVINEFPSEGGVDNEDDEAFRKRIKEYPNIIASQTINRINQAFILLNNNILRTFYCGISNTGKTILAISTQNGASLTENELNDLLLNSGEFLSLSEQKIVNNQTLGVELRNIEYEYIDIDFRADLKANTDPDVIRKSIQTSISKYLDFRFWDHTKKVEWDDLLDIIKHTNGINYVVDESFIPRIDITVSKTKLPRARGFIMRNLNGNIIIDNNNNINPIYYPNQIVKNYAATVL